MEEEKNEGRNTESSHNVDMGRVDRLEQNLYSRRGDL